MMAATNGSILESDSSHSVGTAAIKVQGLRKCFGKLEILKGVDFSVPTGKIHGFLGRNGAGKTTTIGLLMGLLRADSGRISMFGRDVERVGPMEKRLIGHVSQEPRFYEWMTCSEAGRFFSGFYPTWDNAEFAALLSRLDLPPSRRFGKLSGGMKTKLALALALAHRPRLLILDEPTAGLDPFARREFLDLVKEFGRLDGRTTFFSTHRIDEVEKLADGVGIIDGGRTVYNGRVAALNESYRWLIESDKSVECDSNPLPLPQGAVVQAEKAGSGSRMVLVKADTRAWRHFCPEPGWELRAAELEDILMGIIGDSPDDE